jgi:hypothetical protein
MAMIVAATLNKLLDAVVLLLVMDCCSFDDIECE